MYFAENAVVEADVHQNVVGAAPESVLDAHYLQLLRALPADSVDLLVYSADLLLPRGALTSEQIPNLEGE